MTTDFPFGHVVLVIGASGLAAFGLALVSAMLFGTVKDAVRSLRRVSWFRRIVTVGLVVAAVQYGGSKAVYYGEGVKQDGINWFTNDVVHITWQRDTSEIVIPPTAAVYIDYRHANATNEEWGLLAQSVVSAGFWEGSVGVGELATNYDYSVWAYYIPPEPVHTNGVWSYKTIYDPEGVKPVPIGTRMYLDGRTIVPAERND